MAMVQAYTMVSEDGVIGLNGRQYLLDNAGDIMLFKSIDDAKGFIEEAGEDPENEFIDYSEVEKDGTEYDLYHDGTRIE